MNGIVNQIRLLEDVKEKLTLDFDLFCQYHDQILSEKHQGSVRDGSIVRCEAHVPLLGNESILVIDVISAYWDTLYRIEFFGVVNVVYDKELYRFPEIASIGLTFKGGGYKEFFMKAFYSNVTASIVFKNAKILKHVLRSPIAREDIKPKDS